MKLRAIVMFCLTSLLGLSASLQAQQVPGLINAQGRLFDGEKLINGPVQMVLRLYDQPTAGELLYEDTSTVQVVDGIYSTYLGDNTTLGSLPAALSKGPVYLEVTANGVTYSPRERIASVAYSLVAEGVRQAGVTAEMLGPSSVTTDALASGAVTAGKLAENSVGSAVIIDGGILESDIADGAVTPPKLSQSYWTTSGNVMEGGKVSFLGTVDNRPFDIRVNNLRALRLEPTAESPNVIAGHEVNDVVAGVIGAVVSGGGQPNQPNQVKAEFGAIGGGADNLATGPHTVIAGGLSNAASGSRSAIGGGRGNLAVGSGSVIAGGFSNLVNQSYATIAGGYANRAEGYVSAVLGGWGNVATGQVAVVSGGQENEAYGAASVIGGGWMNRALGYGSVVAGGRTNAADGDYASIGGGTNNFVTGNFAVIPGGVGNLASGKGSFAAGMNAKASHDGVFAWSGGGSDLVSSGPGQFLIQAPGNVGIDTDRPDQKLTVKGKVKADGFIGSGADITGVIADNVIPGSLGNDAFKVDAAIAPSKIAGTALTRDTEFNGAVQGRYNQLVIRPGSISLTELKPGLIEQVLEDSELITQLRTLKGKALTHDTPLGGVLSGTFGAATLAEGSVGLAQIQPGVVEKIIAASPIATEVARMGSAFLPVGTPFAGEVNGPATNLVIQPGSITIEKLAPDTIKALGAASELAAELKAHRDEALTYRTDFTGDIVGRGSTLKLAPGAVRAENIAAGVLEGAIAASPLTETIKALDANKLGQDTIFAGDVEGPANKLTLRPGVVGAEHLQPGLLIKAIQESDLAAQIAGLQGKILTQESPVGGDVTGTVGAIKLLPEAIIRAAGVEDIAARIAGLEKKVNDTETSVITATQAMTNGRREIMSEVVGALKTSLTNSSPFAGDVTGTVSAIRIAPGVIAETNLTQELRAKLATAAGAEGKLIELASAIDDRLAEVATGFLPRTLSFGGDITGHADAIRIREGAIHEQHLSRELQDRLASATSNTRVDTLASQLDARLTAATTALEQKLATSALREGSVTNRHLARAAVTTDKIADGSITPEKLSFPLPKAGATPPPAAQGFRIVDHPESPNVMGGHPANKFDRGVVGSVVVGGGNAEHPNIIRAEYGTISGGFGNQVIGFDGAIGGGQDNVAGGTAGVIGGGFLNKTDGIFPVISGGAANESIANLAVISGGFSNRVSGAYATIPGGYQNRASGEFSLAAGRRANAAHTGSFVWADAMEGEFASTDSNQFLARASGGVYFYTNSRLTSGAKLNPGSGSWSMLSDRNAKHNLKPVNGDDILTRLAQMPIHLWSYVTQDDGIRHIGPTAQDFRTAFGLGEEETHISAVDADGVALTAIQALNRKVDLREEEIRQLKEENKALKTRLEAIERRLAP